VIISYALSFANHDLDAIRESLDIIASKSVIAIIVSSIIFLLAYKGASVNLMVFTISIIATYVRETIKNYEIEEINKENN
jgi:ABC-type uncharacterized transport system permease subunit